ARRAQTAAPISPLAPITRMRTGSLPLLRAASLRRAAITAPLGRLAKRIPLASPIRRLYPSPIRRRLSYLDLAEFQRAPGSSGPLRYRYSCQIPPPIIASFAINVFSLQQQCLIEHRINVVWCDH